MPSVAIIGTRGYPSYYGGFETAVRRLAPFLAERGWDVLVYGRDGATVADDPRFDPRVRTKTTSGLESKSLSTLTYGLSATLDSVRERPDVALVMNVANGFWLPILHSRGIPTLVNVDGIEWDRDKWGALAKAVFRRGARMTAKWGGELVYDAKEIERRWGEDFGRRGTFIPYGGDSSPTLELEKGLEPRKYVLVVARFVPENTIPEFFAAVEAIAETTDVIIVGSSGYGGPLDESAEQLAKAHSRVKWLGHVKDDNRLFALWQHAGAYFHGHSVGGTNPALVQAMALGAPTVARDTPYNREVLGESGIFVEPDPTQIASAITRLLGDTALQDRLAAGAQSRAESEYTWELVCSRYENALAELAGHGVRRRRSLR
ncbi:glycosyltransferase [Pseudoclavibacter helvolus]|uniref:glycosyltransferase n=1 Tax=Pseudoclavibacter helvolus TaxID=255205 RepID=UPI000838356C|nr:glycosyltransferase [Pseudoclavibacter helvolus]